MRKGIARPAPVEVNTDGFSFGDTLNRVLDWISNAPGWFYTLVAILIVTLFIRRLWANNLGKLIIVAVIAFGAAMLFKGR